MIPNELRAAWEKKSTVTHLTSSLSLSIDVDGDVFVFTLTHRSGEYAASQELFAGSDAAVTAWLQEPTSGALYVERKLTLEEAVLRMQRRNS